MVQEIESLQTQIQRILQSKAFRTSEVQRNLLAYLADKSIHGTADSLKEYTIGLDVFGKPASYDPRQESAVRMHVGRLRQKLADYYRLEGTEDPVVVDLPKGGFKVTFEPRTEPRVVEVPQIEPSSSPYYRREIALAVALLVAASCAGYLGMRLWRLERTETQAQAPGWTPELQQLWAPILASNRPLMICLSTLPGSGPPASGTPAAAGVTTIGTANGAFLLGQFLGQRKKNIQLTPSDQLSMPEIAMGNVVFVGPAGGGRQIRALPEDRQLVLGPEGIRNSSPRPGEAALLADRNPADPQDTAESYALISHFPGLNGNGELLYFSGNKIPAVMGAVQYFTDPADARTLVTKMKTGGGTLPHYYQVVLKIRSMDEMPIDVSYVLHRDLDGLNPAAPGGSSVSQ
ncbi:MAG TPA: hypothetical protein VGG72_36135 [Bryobacteraceae bacterium]|jgi:hypothetical protein